MPPFREGPTPSTHPPCHADDPTSHPSCARASTSGPVGSGTPAGNTPTDSPDLGSRPHSARCATPSAAGVVGRGTRANLTRLRSLAANSRARASRPPNPSGSERASPYSRLRGQRHPCRRPRVGPGCRAARLCSAAWIRQRTRATRCRTGSRPVASGNTSSRQRRGSARRTPGNCCGVDRYMTSRHGLGDDDVPGSPWAVQPTAVPVRTVRSKRATWVRMRSAPGDRTCRRTPVPALPCPGSRRRGSRPFMTCAAGRGGG